MILNLASSLYGAAASWRRRRYASRFSRARRLAQPVISVGNLSVGGSGKTPVVAHVAAMLLEAGERPAVLTRGYARRAPRDGVTVVSDRERVLEGIDAAGDEPLLLARTLPGVPVLVGADRFLSGRFAEARFNATVHVLDDGFQHLALARDVDLLLADEGDLRDRVLPAGRLREPLSAASAADAVLVPSASPDVGRSLGAATVFTIDRVVGAPATDLNGRSVFAVAGIARPERFFADLVSAGWQVAGTRAFRDHHAFTAQDLGRVAAEARACGAAAVVTTAKDAVRLPSDGCNGLPIVLVPLRVSVEPHDAFREWLLHRIGAARASCPSRGATR